MRRPVASYPGAPPRYQQILDELAEEIRSGRVGPGDKLPSESALVKKYDTSRITVGRALRELQNSGLIERRAGSGSYVKGRNERAGSLLFGLLIPDLGETDIFDPICHGISSAPESADHALLWGHTDARDKNKEEQCWRLCQQFIARRVAGVFLAPLEFEVGAEASNRRVLQALERARIPVVLLDRRPFAKPMRMQVDLVGLNNRQAGYLATEHLIRLGCRRIGFLSQQAAASTVSGRVAGYADALRDAGLPDALGDGAESAEMDGCVCINDRVASSYMRAFLQQGMRIPQDLRMVGIDDVPYARMLPVPLTTVRQPCQEIGEAAMRAMLERIERPDMPGREILLEGSLVVRESCGAGTAH